MQIGDQSTMGLDGGVIMGEREIGLAMIGWLTRRIAIGEETPQGS